MSEHDDLDELDGPDDGGGGGAAGLAAAAARRAPNPVVRFAGRHGQRLLTSGRAIAAGVAAAVLAGLLVSSTLGSPVSGIAAHQQRTDHHQQQLAAACGVPVGADAQDDGTQDERAAVAAQVAYDVGLRGDNLILAVAIAGAESGWRANFDNSRSGPGGTRLNSNGTVDYGIWQINTVHNPPIPEIYDPAVNASFMWRVSRQGTTWTPWVVYNTGAYQRHMDTARRVVVDLLGQTAYGPPPADPAFPDLDLVADPCGPLLGDGTVAGDAVVFAMAQIGTSYSQCHSHWPACGPGGRFGHPSGVGGHYDCSGLVVRMYREAGLELPTNLWTTLQMRRATDPGGALRRLAVADGYQPDRLVPGDVLVWTNGPNTGGHMGIYIGDGQVIHASVSRGVVVDPLEGQFSRRTQRIVRPSLLAVPADEEVT